MERPALVAYADIASYSLTCHHCQDAFYGATAEEVSDMAVRNNWGLVEGRGRGRKIRLFAACERCVSIDREMRLFEPYITRDIRELATCCRCHAQARTYQDDNMTLREYIYRQGWNLDPNGHGLLCASCSR